MNSEPIRANPLLSNPFEQALRSELLLSLRASTPPQLREALEYALFPGGARLRPALCMLVAEACGDAESRWTMAAACAIEMVHGASLVHDDLPCFDDAERRRGRPSLHAKYGESMAVLVGDALLVAAFGVLGRSGNARGVEILAEASGPGSGIIAGQAWELEPSAPLEEYHRAKTASLFEAAAALGAISSGANEGAWRAFGAFLGMAFQAADDLGDIGVVDLGKPTGKDAALGRPSIVRTEGPVAARQRVKSLLDRARAEIPESKTSMPLQRWLEGLAQELLRR